MVDICHVCDRPVTPFLSQNDDQEAPHPHTYLPEGREEVAAADRDPPDLLDVDLLGLSQPVPPIHGNQPQLREPLPVIQEHDANGPSRFEGSSSEPNTQQQTRTVCCERFALVRWLLVMAVGFLMATVSAAATLIGFDSQGIAAGSWAATMENAHERSGSWFARLESWGARGWFVTGMTYGIVVTVIGFLLYAAQQQQPCCSDTPPTAVNLHRQQPQHQPQQVPACTYDPRENYHPHELPSHSSSQCPACRQPWESVSSMGWS